MPRHLCLHECRSLDKTTGVLQQKLTTVMASINSAAILHNIRIEDGLTYSDDEDDDDEDVDVEDDDQQPEEPLMEPIAEPRDGVQARRSLVENFFNWLCLLSHVYIAAQPLSLAITVVGSCSSRHYFTHNHLFGLINDSCISMHLFTYSFLLLSRSSKVQH